MIYFLQSEEVGIGLLLPSGSCVLEVSSKELHSTTKVLTPNAASPTRLYFLMFINLDPIKLNFQNWSCILSSQGPGEEIAWTRQLVVFCLLKIPGS